MARTAEDPSLRRVALLRAARAIVDESGSGTLSIRGLAARAGASPTSVYELFGSKEGLLVALLQEHRASYVQRLMTEAAGDPLEQFFKAIELSAKEVSHSFDFFKAATFQYFSENGSEMRSAFDSQRLDLFRSLVSRIVSEAELRPVALDMLVDQLDCLYAGALFRWMVCRGDGAQFERQFGLGCALALKAILPDRFQRYLDKQLQVYAASPSP